MAATGMGGGGTAWVPPDPHEREALMLETVKLTVELGIDVNAVNTDGRTALDAAKTLKFNTVVDFLVAHGAKPGPAKKVESTK
jgi:ankyrin repeat protein